MNDPLPDAPIITVDTAKVELDGLLRIRKETMDDAAFLVALFESVKGPEFASLPGGETLRRQLLDLQYRAMTASYRQAFPQGSFDIVLLDDIPIGRLITGSTADRFRIVYIALLPEWRQRGLATALMTEVLCSPRAQGLRCETDVAHDNVASLRLWERLGFTERARDAANIFMARDTAIVE